LENKKSKIFAQLHLLNKIDQTSRYGSKRGFIKVWPNNSYEHEKIKFDIAFKLINEGWHVFSETNFGPKVRADIVAISPAGTGIIVEIETPKSEKAWKKKVESKMKYPDEFNLFIINSNKFDIDKFKV
jgi:hypothetical protein